MAASNWQDKLAYYANWGPGLDVIAPGGELCSNTTNEAGIWSAVRGGYGYFQGTSMAAPQVTGTAAIVASFTGLSGMALRGQIEGTVDDRGDGGYDTRFGQGRLNSYRAVTGTTLVEGEPPPPPPPTTLKASFTYSCDGLTCAFDGSGSTGAITGYGWAFGDGGSGSGAITTHMYGGAGSYTVTLTVTDGSATDATSQTIRCKQRGKNGVACR